MLKGIIGQQISFLTVIVVHLTMHLMHHNHCQITTMCVCVDVLVDNRDQYISVLCNENLCSWNI